MEINRVNYQQFREAFLPMGCFTGEQVKVWNTAFGRDNFRRWVSENKLIRLRQNLYTFPDLLKKPDSAWYFAGKIYPPSYISLHTALHFYGIIPEEVVQFTSVTVRKTAFFENRFGQFSYKSVSPKYMFGYEIMHPAREDGFVFYMATPEKAIIDLMHLYSIYNTEQDMIDIRFDENYMKEELNVPRIIKYCEQLNSPVLTRRIKVLLEAYHVADI